MNFAKGLFRLWIVAAIIWLGFVAYIVWIDWSFPLASQEAYIIRSQGQEP